MSELESLIKQVNKDFKSEIAHIGPGEYNYIRVPFTSVRLNYMLYGGLPLGKLIEFSGDNNSGKTTTALDAVKNFQLTFEDRRVVFVDCENTFDVEWAKKLGVDVDNLVLIQPDNQTAEDIFEMCLKFIDTGEVSLLVIDSLGVMLSEQAFNKTIAEKTYGGIASALTTFSKKAVTACARNDCTLLGINQMREDMGSMYGGTVTTGGKAWKHNCIQRLQFRKGDYIDYNGKKVSRACENPAGNIVHCNIIKNKGCIPDRKVGFYTLRYDTGIDYILDTIDVAITLGIVLAAGAWYSLVDIETGEVLQDDNGKDLKFQGRENLKNYLLSNKQLWDKFYADVNNSVVTSKTF